MEATMDWDAAACLEAPDELWDDGGEAPSGEQGASLMDEPVQQFAPAGTQPVATDSEGHPDGIVHPQSAENSQLGGRYSGPESSMASIPSTMGSASVANTGQEGVQPLPATDLPIYRRDNLKRAAETFARTPALFKRRRHAPVEEAASAGGALSLLASVGEGVAQAQAGTVVVHCWKGDPQYHLYCQLQNEQTAAPAEAPLVRKHASDITLRQSVHKVARQKGISSGRTYTSKFRGVHQTFPTRRWEAQFRRAGKPTSLGCFDTEEEAARAYDKMMIWCDVHNAEFRSLGLTRNGVTNFSPEEYAADMEELGSITQDELVQRLRKIGRLQAAAHAGGGSTRQRGAQQRGGGDDPSYDPRKRAAGAGDARERRGRRAGEEDSSEEEEEEEEGAGDAAAEGAGAEGAGAEDEGDRLLIDDADAAEAEAEAAQAEAAAAEEALRTAAEAARAACERADKARKAAAQAQLDKGQQRVSAVAAAAAVAEAPLAVAAAPVAAAAAVGTHERRLPQPPAAAE